ncbi:tRNA (uracil(54)-C(5))-methyltransferase-like protein [Patagioenas fasciata monilis]|uniref:tRNA (uracil(54)-C(5))-methyltransferase n=1 Tax=Patagioenas fasciata monilis TaxID=372326 RepID=A0A1V4KYH3_PATFA|nr:tRNA (uracil(54)-C(5))-methyltransferase-like protein [Patagioenas fasciata monilis]
MALSWALRLPCRHLCPLSALLSSLPGRDHSLLTEKRAAKQKEKKKPRKGCSLPGSSWEERLANAVTPLWRLPYQEQLQVKYESQRKILQTLASRLKELGIDVQQPDGLCCPLQPVVPSPVITGYRNKSTFSVNRGPDGNPKTVGLYVGTGRARNIVCVKANHMENIPSKHKQVAQCYEDFIRCSPLDSCLLFHEGGHWRELVVRTTSRGHTMAIVTFHPQDLGQEALAMQKALLKEFFTCGPGRVCALTSLYFQESTMTRCSHEQSPFQLLHGEPHIFEEVLGLKFRISPDAFFQVNTDGAEVLYQAVGELIQAGGDTVLLDICCGTGTIGLSLAHQVSKVIGIEVVAKAIEDARWNAAFNGISNCEFHGGRAEAVLPQLLSSWESPQPLVAVVNPSRAGLHYRVVRAIRNCKSIRRLLYISCKPEGEAMRNFLELCCPPDPRKKLAGEPFTPTLVIPFDMFPHTVHCELVLLFTR